MNKITDFVRENMLDLIYSSARVEGLPFSKAVTKSILCGDYSNFNINVNALLNIKRGYDYVINNLHKMVDFDTVVQLHLVLMKGLHNSFPGLLREVPVRIEGSSYRPGKIIPQLVFSDINAICFSGNEPLIKACGLFCYLTKTQVFTDGNKRVATLACNMILLQSGVGVFVLPYSNAGRVKFADSLVEYYEVGDFELFYRNMFLPNIRYIDRYIDGRKK